VTECASHLGSMLDIFKQVLTGEISRPHRFPLIR